MGLDVIVGISAEDLELDEDNGHWWEEMVEPVNAALAAHGLRPHVEPETLPAERCYQERVGTYGTLHHLRRIAAYLERGLALPSPFPADQRVISDPVVKRRYETLSPKSRFAHLIEHSDAEGFYIPIAFAEVIIDPNVTGGSLGSSFALRRECEELARVLRVPLDLDTESTELYEGGDGSKPWHAYHIEARTCLVLYRAAVTSIESGAAIVFT